ncbi:MAG TPA: bifunctional adenosylcobinamide kinase/adenosylcobinamide-phosphate guanylyltransferase [Motilibacteraceae bacterium]|nr:bifunctional adenosylcobinamide kinase/adenosylcobinamide-phosphate guanylyltransferase [Motilibacteraceae bacterium]
MEVVLLGTGGADGWPNPFCTCSSCEALRAEGTVRGQTAALVDDVLLLDCGPEAPRAAARAGRSLAGVRHVLLTHSHPDHTGPAALLWRHWAHRREPLDVVGPQAALDACRDWIGPDDPVRLVPVATGDRLALGDYDVRVLQAAHGDAWSGDAVLYDVASESGRLLYSTDTGPLPQATVDACTGAGFDLVLLEETFGDVAVHGTGHLDLTTFPRALAALREVGAVVPNSDVVAVHLCHHNPPTAELAARLAPWGARLVPDGAVLRVGQRSPVPSPLPRRTLVLGGARSGKSTHAEWLLSAEPSVRYAATGGMREGDVEWAARVAAHRARRPAGWRTLETTDLLPLLAEPGPLLVDCLSLWLTTVLDEAGAWDGDPAALDEARGRVDELVAAWRSAPGPVVAVSNEVGSGVVPATASGRMFRDELGRLNARIAAESDDVVLLVAGLPTTLRPARVPAVPEDR